MKAAQDTADESARLAAAVGIELKHLNPIHVHHLKLRPNLSVQDAIAQLRQYPEVEYAEPNYIVHAAGPNDTYYVNGDQWAPPKIGADLAWNIWYPVSSPIIAILDTGVNNAHQDLTNNMLRDANGILGYDAVTKPEGRSTATDWYGHGTSVAGAAAAETNNGIGIAGIASYDFTDRPVWNPKIMPVRVLNNMGKGNTSDCADGINWAVSNGAKVLNMSLVYTPDSSTLDAALLNAWNSGCVLVAAAGNGLSEPPTDGTSAPFYPAASPHVISVAATDHTDTLAQYSNYGSWVLTAAPGGYPSDGILSTDWGGGYLYGYATSIACPQVSGEAAVLMGQYPSLSNAKIKHLITSCTDPYAPYGSNTLAAGAGRVNVWKALKEAARFDFTGDGQPDFIWQYTTSGLVNWWQMNGTHFNGVDGTVSSDPNNVNWKVVAAPDMDGNGHPGLLVQNQTTGEVDYWHMNGTQKLGTDVITSSQPTSWKVVGAADMDRSGHPGILWSNQATGQLNYWHMNGTQYISYDSIIQSQNTNWQVVGTPDLDGDGNPDILWQYAPTGQLNYWLMQKDVFSGTWGVITSDPGGPNWKVVGTPDLTNDGQPDLLWWNSSSGVVNYWQMNGVSYTGTWGNITQSPDLNWRIVGIH